MPNLWSLTFKKLEFRFYNLAKVNSLLKVLCKLIRGLNSENELPPFFPKVRSIVASYDAKEPRRMVNMCLVLCNFCATMEVPSSDEKLIHDQKAL